MTDSVSIRNGSYRPLGFYALHPLDAFVGRHVKIGFRFTGKNREFMWVKVASVVGGELEGTLDNDPVVVTYVKYGDTVQCGPEEIVDVD